MRTRAVRLVRDGDRGPKAIETNARILELAPDDVAALNRRGRCHFERGDFAAAKADYERALALNPAGTVARNYLRKIERIASGRGMGATRRERERAAAKSRRKPAEHEARRREEAEEARVLAEDLQVAGGLNDFEEARSLGVVARRGRPPNYPLAIAAFRRAFELDRRRYDVLTMLAATYRAYKQLGKAEKVYRWLLAREDSTHARVGLAAVYTDTARPAMARELYEEVLDREPANPYALMGLGRVLYALDLPDEAVETFEKAAKFAEGRETARDAVAELEKMRETYQDRGEADRAEWIGSILDRLRAR